MTMKELEHNLARGGMVITVMKYSDTQTHYVVVHGMSKHNVYLADGARLYTPSGRITRRHFRRLWTRGGITTQP